MRYAVVMYSSVLVANRAKRLLKDKCSNLKIIQVPSVVSTEGCNYALKCNMNDLNIVIEVSNQYDLIIKNKFEEIVQDGKKVYFKL